MEASTGIDFVKQAMQHDCMADPAVGYLWMWLVAQSAESNQRTSIKNGRSVFWFDLQVGEVIINFTLLAEILNCSRQAIYNRLSRLEESGLIETRSYTKVTVVFVVNSRTKTLSEKSEVTPKLHQSYTKQFTADSALEDEFDDSLQSISISVSDAVKQPEPTNQPSNLFGDIEQPKKRKPAVKSQKFDPREYPIPESLDTPEFREAWEDWINNRIEIGKPLKPTACKLQMKWMAEVGLEKAISTMKISSSNQWQGLWEPDKKQGGSQQEPRKMTKLA